MEYVIPAAIHPIFVHFAIALTLFGVGLDAFALLRGKSHWHEAAKMNLIGGVVAMAAAVASGWWDHERWHEVAEHTHFTPNLMEMHEYLGWSLLALFSLLLIWRIRSTTSPSRSFVWIALVGALGILVQGHIGGQMVFLQGAGIRVDLEEPEVSVEPEGTVQVSPSEEKSHDHEGHEH
jgi:uncharacterized membrane protein